MVSKAVVALIVVLIVGAITTALVLILVNNDIGGSDPPDTSGETEEGSIEDSAPEESSQEGSSQEGSSPEETEEQTIEDTDENTEEDVSDIGGDLPYRIGVGIADMTGPCTDINFMGYAEFGQSGSGIHLRQFSRAFIFREGDTRFVYVVTDVQAVGIAVRRGVVEKLQELYGDTYSLRNVIIAGTHTHSAPGGHLVDFILDISILGFSQETYDAYVAGITQSIIRAHGSMVPARLFYGETEVLNAHMNRSPYSYQNNPPEERERYERDTDDTLSQLRIERANGDLLGVINWFAIHTTSMNLTNHLISSDNLGYAAITMEKTLNPDRLVGRPDIVAAFTPTSLGDISPNTRGARCEFSGDECDNHFEVCELLERCYSLGPGEDMFESTKIIGNMIYEGAMQILSTPGEELTGHFAIIHQFVEMSSEVVPRYDPIERTFDVNDPVRGCVPALGYSFASGTIDGANVLNITQGTVTGNPLLDDITNIVGAATPDDEECHAPKPILLATGRSSFPLEWHPTVISVSLLWLGGLAVAGIPGEPTTMAGRRIKDVIGQVLENHDLDRRVVVSGIVNEYIHYVATYEEYQVQRYEAASTIYGPHSLDIFLNKLAEFTTVALEGEDVEPGPLPIDNRGRTISLILPVVFDAAAIGRSFGDVLDQPDSTVQRGDTVEGFFVAASPRNDLKQGDSHAVIERLVQDNWVVVATDADWETKFTWTRAFALTPTSRVTFSWDVPLDAQLGTYRIRYNGAARSVLGNITPFEGITDSFTVTE